MHKRYQSHKADKNPSSLEEMKQVDPGKNSTDQIMQTTNCTALIAFLVRVLGSQEESLADLVWRKQNSKPQSES